MIALLDVLFVQSLMNALTTRFAQSVIVIVTVVSGAVEWLAFNSTQHILYSCSRVVEVSASVNLPLHHKSRGFLLAPAHPGGPGKGL